MRAFAVLLCGLLAACGTATFQPEAWGSGGPPLEARAAADWELQQIRRAHGGEARAAGLTEPLAFAVQVRDLWQSGILRWFTPLDANDQSFVAMLVVEPPAVEADLDGRLLRWSASRADEAGDVPARVDGWDAVYLDSLHRYFLLPLLPFDESARLPAASYEGRAYRRLWARYGEDEVVLWSVPETGRLRLAEFTFRAVGKGYTGVLDFAGWTEFPTTDGWETRLLPSDIVVRNHLRGGIVHRLLVEPQPIEIRK